MYATNEFPIRDPFQIVYDVDESKKGLMKISLVSKKLWMELSFNKKKCV